MIERERGCDCVLPLLVSDRLNKREEEKGGTAAGREREREREREEGKGGKEVSRRSKRKAALLESLGPLKEGRKS
jgi:hypothetical protein